LKILIIEPFFTGSHKAWAEGYQKYSSHKVKILSLPGRFWKWRMHGGAVTLAKRYHKLKFQPDLILATDMLNLPIFQSLIQPACPVAIYFHENQFSYPWSPKDIDVELQRDKHYGFINYSSALSAHHVFFNSQFHMDSFFIELENFLRKFPDYREIQNIEKINKKSSVLHLGLDLHKFDPFESEKNDDEVPIILWNHRWEHDKNPEVFFELIQELSQRGVDFNLVVLGEEYKDEQSCFTHARKTMDKHILQFGYTDSFDEYAKWLWQADILPVTSNQDFFGASIMEAIYCNTIPLLPMRLTYPNLFHSDQNPEIFYQSPKELIYKLENMLCNNGIFKRNNYKEIAMNYDWSIMAEKYDDKLENLEQ
jgi:glycosyltransferase involved in cell wall biosynthesis